MNLFNIMAKTSITALCKDDDLQQLWGIIGTAFKLLLLGIPILLVIFGLIDLGKAVMAGKDDEIKSAQKMLMKRIIYTVGAFLFLAIVMAVIRVVDGEGSEVAACLKTIFG